MRVSVPPLADLERVLAAAQLVLAIFGMGAVLTPADFMLVFRKPQALWIGLSIQLVGVPLVAWVFGAVLPIPPGVAAGLALVAAVPGGTLSNIFTFLAGGNVALSVSLTGVSTLGALVSTPAILRILIGAGLPGDAALPVDRVARDIVLALLVPLAAGMTVGARLPSVRQTIARWAVRLSLVCIAALAVVGGSQGKLDPHAYGAWGIGAIVLLALTAQTVAVAAARLGRLPERDGLAIGVEATVRNTNLALLVQTSLFPGGGGGSLADGMFFVALLYGGVALPVACVPLLSRRFSGRKRR